MPLFALLLLTFTLAAAQAAAVPLCSEDEQAMSLMEGDETAPRELADAVVAEAEPAAVPTDVDHGVLGHLSIDTAAAQQAELELADAEKEEEAEERLIIPCALVESGAFGPVCLDASGYLVTTTGVVLCEVRGLPGPGITDPEREVDSSPRLPGINLEGGAQHAAARSEDAVRLSTVHTDLGAKASSRSLGPGRSLGPPGVPPA